jgi:hypothetical protein
LLKANTLELAAKRLYEAAEILKTCGGTVSAFTKRVDEDIPRIARFSAQCQLAAEDIANAAKVKRASATSRSDVRKRRS